MPFKKFSFNSLDEIIQENSKLGINLHFSTNLGVLGKPVEVNGFVIPNSLAVHPMEGCDGNFDGSPSDLTIRRYKRFAAGGAGLVWFEAVATVPEGRATPRQLWINRGNVGKFKQLMTDIRETAQRESGNSFRPLCVMQLTHSGRFSKPEGKPAPIIAYHNPYLHTAMNIEPDYPVISDGELEKLEESFEEAAVLAKEAGFDGVDVKCCHRYLNSELLSAYTRKGVYGETFEGRTRFLLNAVDRIRSRIGKGFIVTTRLNIYDGIPYPYGWGVDRDDCHKYDLMEPIKLIGILQGKGVSLINLTMGTPYYNPHVNRPYDLGPYVPDEHPLNGVARLIGGVGEVQKSFPQMIVVGTGYSWLRQFSQYLAAGSIEKGLATIVGFGREAFAYPEFARDILNDGSMKGEKCCIACGKCTEIMRAGGTTGCVIRDAEVFAPIYNEAKRCPPPH